MNAISPPLPPGVVTLADHETHAASVLDNNAWAYFAGAAADETTLQHNQDAWRALQLKPRVLRRLAGGHTRRSLLGRSLAHPILLAPVAYQRMAHPDGELGSAVAQLVRQFFPGLTTFSYSPEVKTRLVMKAWDVVSKGRLEFDAGWTDLASSLMAIRKTVTPGGRQFTYTAGRNEHTGHADHVEADHPAMQLVVQFEEEVAANGLGQHLAALGVHQE